MKSYTKRVRKSTTSALAERAGAKYGHVLILPLRSVHPSPENDELYNPVDPTDPDFQALVDSIKKHGVREPLLVTADFYILSGHRRHAAAKRAGLTEVPCRIDPTSRLDDDGEVNPRFVLMLREHNRQRVKTLAEVLREEVVSADPEEAYRALLEHRRQAARVKVQGLDLGSQKQRAKISKAKRPFLDAIVAILNELRDYWPLSIRLIHYNLLNDPPLKHAGKPETYYCNRAKRVLSNRYDNTLLSYKNADDLITRARFEGLIPFEAIDDPTRSVVTWEVHQSPAGFIRRCLDDFLKGYSRDLMQSQPNHVEIIGEKNTIEGVIRPVAMDYCIPYTLGRGYSSVPPRKRIHERFVRSGKEGLILLFLADFDPEGEDIGRSFARSMRDDFGLTNITPVKVTLTAEQVREMDLPPQMKAKEGSSRRDGFVERHGDDVFEMEAVPPPQLQRLLLDTLTAVIDIERFNAEVENEKRDAAQLDRIRRQAHGWLRDLNFED